MTSLCRIALCGAVFLASTVASADDDAPLPPSETEPTPLPPKKQPTGEFGVGVGYNPDDGVIFGTSVRQTRLFGTHQGLALTADLSELRQRMNLAYDVPDVLGAGLDLRTELFSTRIAYPTFARAAAGGQATLSHRVDRATSVFVRYRVEAVTVEPTDVPAARALVPPDAGPAGYAWLGAGLRYDTRDRPIPTRGTYVELLGETADPRVGSDAKLMRLSARLEHAMPLGPFTLRLGGRAANIDGPRGVPLSERLAYDGNAEVRGYGIGSFGDAGANFAASGHAELELPILPKLGISVAGFLDAGVRYNADPTFGPVGATTMRSAGASIIWRSPIGPLRFDWAQPLDGDKRDRVFMFSLGAGF